MKVVNGKPHFVNRTFAEYFTACWFSRNFEYDRSVMKRIFLTLDIGSWRTCSSGCWKKTLRCTVPC